jgi:hypothetical protein
MSGSLNQLRRAELTATCRLAVSPCLWQSSHVAPIRCSATISDLSPGNFVHANPHRQIFARRKEWRRLSTPIDSAGCRRLSPIRLCLTGAAPTSLRSSTPSCAAPPSQRRSQISITSCQHSSTMDDGRRLLQMSRENRIVERRPMGQLRPIGAELAREAHTIGGECHGLDQKVRPMLYVWNK